MKNRNNEGLVRVDGVWFVGCRVRATIASLRGVITRQKRQIEAMKNPENCATNDMCVSRICPCKKWRLRK